MDPDHGYAPRTIHCTRTDLGVPFEAIETARYKRVGDIWLPVIGTRATYEVEDVAHDPGLQSRLDEDRQSWPRRLALDGLPGPATEPHLRFSLARLLRAGRCPGDNDLYYTPMLMPFKTESYMPEVVVAAPISVNKELAPCRFWLPLPPDCKFYDAFRNRSLPPAESLSQPSMRAVRPGDFSADPAAAPEVAPQPASDLPAPRVEARDKGASDPAPHQMKHLRAVIGDAEDRGVVPAGSVARRIVRFVNTSDFALQVSVVSKTCGCLEASFDKAEVAPGATATLVLAATVAPVVGPQSQAARVLAKWQEDGTEREQRGNCVIRYSADISFDVLPDFYRITAFEGQPVEVRLWTRWLDEDALRTAQLGPGDVQGIDGFTVTGPMEPEDSRAVRAFIVRGLAPAPGFYRAEVVVHTNVPGRPEVRVPLFLRVEPRWRADPPGAIFDGEPTEAALRLAPEVEPAEGEAPVRARVAEADSPVTAELEPAADGEPQRVKIRFARHSARSSSGSTRIDVLSGNGRCLVSLPVAWFGPDVRRPTAPRPDVGDPSDDPGK